jgi:DNA helicase-2/ATP-dependent DNA helicase PcrA
MASISCVYCGGSHNTAFDVRACWQRNGEPDEPDEPDRPITQATAHQAAHDPGPGPAMLGRNALVLAGQAVPSVWQHLPVLSIGRLDESMLATLQRLAHERSGRVFEVQPHTSPEAIEPQRSSTPPSTLGARFTFVAEAIAHFLTVNTVDLRTGSSFALLHHSLAAGATPVADGRGDVELPDGRRAWLDGGPLRLHAAIDGVDVLHRVSLERASLRTPTGGSPHSELAADQLEAVLHRGGAARIIAPAGSGKTRVLTERARHLVNRWAVPASAVCMVAFNKRAQEEMVERTADVPGLQVRTLNAIALAVLNGSRPFAARPTRVNTVDEPEVRRIVGSLVSFPRKRNADPVATWIEALSVARLGLRAPADVESMYGGDVPGFADVFPRFRTALAQANAVDYDEQVYRAIELLLADPEVRRAAQFACRLLLVDEFQDLTPAHMLLVRLLAGPDGAVFGVGDDDQTIYGYNGADPSWLIDFATLFPGSGEHPLEVNYRCPGGIVRSADTLLRHNRRRVPKVIRSARPELDGFTVAEATGDSVDTTVQAVTAAIAAGTPHTDIAVLTRVNSLLAPVQVALASHGVPVSGGVGRDFVDRTAVRAALAWLRLATAGTSFERSDVAEALRRPNRSLHPRIAEWVAEQSSVSGIRRLAQRLNEARDTERVEAFADDIEALQAMAAGTGTTGRLLAVLRDQLGLATTIASLDNTRHGMNRAAQSDDLTALAQLAGLQPDPRSFEPWLRTALARPWSSSGITLATVHRVKGQEWPMVVVHHADADQFPHRLADDVEEERRLFHVAITRASREVLVVPSDAPSPFILECSTEPSSRTVTATSSARPDASTAKATRPSAPAIDLTPEQAALFEDLRAVRRHLAAGKPAYTVLSDATLKEIAIRRPSSLDQLAAIKGVGPAKLTQYGAAFLASVAGDD